MTTSRTVERPQILFCNCAHYEIIPRAAKDQVLTGLRQGGLEAQVVDDLCGLAATRDPRLLAWAAAPSLAIVACFPRAVRWLFHAAGVALSSDRVRFFNMRTQTPQEIVSAIADSCTGANPQSTIRNVVTPDPDPGPQSDWVPWFPVIDYDRCQNCKQCLNFCLFGVYQLSPEGKVTVQNPAGCKTNCPACARMCSQKAIIFPKYAEAPINGDESSMGVPPMSSTGILPVNGLDAHGRDAHATHGQDARATGDLYDRIRGRSAGRKRFSTEPKEGTSGPSCPTLEGLRRDLGIPDDVLAALSPAELQRAMARKNAGQAQSNSDASDDGKDKKHND